MYADACCELEELEGDDRLSDPVLVCRWKIYRDSENLLGEKAMAAEMVRRFPADWEWRLRTARAVRRYEDAETALVYLNEKAEAFCGYPAYLYEIGRCKCLTGDLKGARDAVREAIKLAAEYPGQVRRGRGLRRGVGQLRGGLRKGRMRIFCLKCCDSSGQLRKN